MKTTSEFRVILIVGTAVFRCATQDVSLHGLTLGSEVPKAFQKTQCLAYISHLDMSENIEIPCQVTVESNGVSAVEFVHPRAQEIERLAEWIQA